MSKRSRKDDLSLGDYLRHYSTLSRFEFLPAISVAILIGLFLGLDEFWSIFDPVILLVIVEGLVIFFLLFNTGFMVNCWADWEVDETYKTHLSDSVKIMGRRTVGQLVAVHIALAVLVSVHVTLIVMWKPYLLVLILIGIFLGVGYSVEPFRFKTRGALHSVMAIPVFMIPGMYSFFLVNDAPLHSYQNLVFYMLAVGITCGHYALVLISQTEDHPDDKAAGITTPAVAWGVNETVDTAFRLNVFGIAATIMAFGLTLVPMVGLIGVLIFHIVVPAQLYGTKNLYRLRAVALKGDAGRTLSRIRERMVDYPKWHAIPLGGVMLLSLIVLIIRTWGDSLGLT